MTSIQLGEPGTSACCILFVNDGKELWVGVGNKVDIITVDTLEVEHKFRAYVSPRSNVRSMVTNGPSVFIINRRTPDVFQWSVETRQCICKFNIDQENPRMSNVASAVTLRKDDDVGKSDVTDDEDDDVIIEIREESREDMLEAAKDPEMYIDVNERPARGCYRQPSLMRALRRGGSRSSSRKKHRNMAEEAVPNDGSDQKMRSRTQVIRVSCFCAVLCEIASVTLEQVTSSLLK